MNPDHYKAIPEPPASQQLASSPTFLTPPLDGSLSLPEIYDWHLQYSPHHTLFEFAEENGSVKALTWGEVVRAVHRAGHILCPRICQDGVPRCTVAILATTDFITYYTVFMGILRLGYAVFFISPRNSREAVAHLMAETGATHLIISPEDGMRKLSAEAIELLTESDSAPPELSLMPSYDDLYPPVPESEFTLLPKININLADLAMVIHTSGSTSFPKPIRYTHHRLFLWCFQPFYGELDKISLRFSCHSTPMYHAMGSAQIAWPAFSGMTITTFKPQTPTIPVTAETVLKGVSDTRSDVIFTLATFIEEWAVNPIDVQKLKTLKGVFFGGAPLSKIVGDSLIEQGVRLYNSYGFGECGNMTELLPKFVEKDWEYIKLRANVEARFIPDQAGTFSQLHILPNAYHVPCVLNAEVDGKPAYATSDYFVPHPTRPDYWKLVDRVDSQIVHSTGEKTNPGPLERILNDDPRVKCAVMFGRGKFNAGVLIDPSPCLAFDLSDEEQLIDFRNRIWPCVEKVNAFAPQHSRIFKEMIIVASPSKPFEYTAKMTPRRGAILAAYEGEIEALYASAKQDADADLKPPSVWDGECTRFFIRTIIHRTLKRHVQDTDDIFQHGCDSLQATWIRHSLTRALKKIDNVDIKSIPLNLIYQNPNIESLSTAILKLVIVDSSEVPAQPDKISVMVNMASKYTSSLPSRTSHAHRDVVLLTGSTGGLGTSLLAKMVLDPDIIRIYAINRRNATGASLAERQREALHDRGYDPCIVDSSKVILLEADMAERDFGLPVGILSEMRSSVTHIVHNAYRVDWNISLSSFEPQIQTIRNLVDLAISSPRVCPPRLIFMSSIAVLGPDGPAKEEPVLPASAVGSGYSESKWVCEQLLEESASRSSLRPIIIRPGQISGGPSGAWNATEWVPSLVCSSIYLKALPSVEKEISWIPADNAAEAVVRMRNSTERILHLAHPRPVPATHILVALSEQLDLPLIPASEWIDRLEACATLLENGEESVKRNPALKLLTFFKDGLNNRPPHAEAFGVTRMDMTKALRESEGSLDTIPKLDKEDVQKWLGYWRGKGLL